MLAVKEYLDKKQAIFAHHSFFSALKEQNNFSEGMAFVPRLMFWVMAFQDILNIIPPQVKSKELRRIANHHKMEDAGHNKWYLEDMAYLEKNHKNTIEWLFSADHKITREVAYRIMSEAFHGKDHHKIVLILALESTGHIFFENISEYAKRNGQDNNLKYLSSYHLEVEKKHEIFEQKLEESLYKLVLSPEDRKEAIDMVDRVYDAFNTLFDYLLEGLPNGKRPRQTHLEHMATIEN